MGRLILLAASVGVLAAEVLVGRPDRSNGAEPPDPLTRGDLEEQLAALRTEARERQAESDAATRAALEDLLAEYTAATAAGVQELRDKLAHVGQAVEEATGDDPPPAAPEGEEEEGDDPGDDPEGE